MNWSDFLLADHEAGTLIWKENVDIPTGRIRNMRNTRFAGKIAGNVGVNGYREVRLLGRLHKAHRILWEMAHGPIPKGYGIDHIDGNPGNNRLLNLRLANQSENNRNTGKPSHNTSGIKGVCFDKIQGKWMARIQHQGRTINLGRFQTKGLAAVARAKAAIRYHGEFARFA